MTVIRFNETQINTVRKEYDFRTNLENPYLIEKSSELKQFDAKHRNIARY